MKCVCNRTKQLRLNDKIVLIRKGAVIDLPDKMLEDGMISGFTPLKGAEGAPSDAVVNFVDGSEEELMQASWTFSEAAKALSAAFDVPLVKEDGDTKKDVVAKILDIRYRAINKNGQVQQ